MNTFSTNDPDLVVNPARVLGDAVMAASQQFGDNPKRIVTSPKVVEALLRQLMADRRIPEPSPENITGLSFWGIPLISRKDHPDHADLEGL